MAAEKKLSSTDYCLGSKGELQPKYRNDQTATVRRGLSMKQRGPLGNPYKGK